MITVVAGWHAETCRVRKLGQVEQVKWAEARRFGVQIAINRMGSREQEV